MAVAIAGTPASVADNGSYTAESGSNRLVVWVFGAEANAHTYTITSCTFGGVSMTQADFQVANGSVDAYAAVYYLKEADIPVGSQTVAVTWSNTMTAEGDGVMYTLTGVNQTSPINATFKNGFVSVTNHELTSVATVDNSVAIHVNFITAVSGAATYTPGTWTERRISNTPSGKIGVLDKTVTTGETANVGYTWPGSQVGAAIATIFAPATGPQRIRQSTKLRAQSATAAGTGTVV